MADPATMAAVGIGTSVFGSLLGAFGAEKEGEGAQQAAQAKSRMYQYQAGVAKVNQDIALQNKDYAFQVGEVEAQQSGMKTRAQVGETKAAQGASGLKVGSGSAADVVESEGEIGRQNQAIIRSNAARQAYGYDIKAMEAGQQKTMYEMSSADALRAGDIAQEGAHIKAATSILGGATSVASKWSQASSAFGSGGGGVYSSSMDPSNMTGTGGLW